jgi:hypothetical protein
LLLLVRVKLVPDAAEEAEVIEVTEVAASVAV